MVAIVKQKQPLMPISIVQTNTYKHGGYMITIGKIPQKVKGFFKPAVTPQFCLFLWTVRRWRGSDALMMANRVA